MGNSAVITTRNTEFENGIDPKRNEAGMYSGLKPMGIPKKLDVTILTQKTETAQELRLMPEAGTCQTCGHTGTDVTERTYRVCDGTYVTKTECRKAWVKLNDPEDLVGALIVELSRASVRYRKKAPS